MTELAIRTKRLTKQFESNLAVNNINLNIRFGEVYGLVGENGAGKTTLLRMLATAEEPTSGEIYLHETLLSPDKDNLRVKRLIAYLPEDFPLYSDLTVWKYLNYFARLYKLQEPKLSERLEYVLELVGLTEKRHALTSNLSRGMKQRLSLARTIIHEPVILILDEPVSGLDPNQRHNFLETIKILQEAGMTIVISSHILNDLEEICTSIGIINQGRLIENTSLQELYRRYNPNSKLLLSPLSISDTEMLSTKLDRLVILEDSLVQSWKKIANTKDIEVEFTGGQEDSAHFLKSLINSGILLTEFRHIQQDLDDIFAKIVK